MTSCTSVWRRVVQCHLASPNNSGIISKLVILQNMKMSKLSSWSIPIIYQIIITKMVSNYNLKIKKILKVRNQLPCQLQPPQFKEDSPLPEPTSTTSSHLNASSSLRLLTKMMRSTTQSRVMKKMSLYRIRFSNTTWRRQTRN